MPSFNSQVVAGSSKGDTDSLLVTPKVYLALKEDGDKGGHIICIYGNYCVQVFLYWFFFHVMETLFLGYSSHGNKSFFVFASSGHIDLLWYFTFWEFFWVWLFGTWIFAPRLRLCLRDFNVQFLKTKICKNFWLILIHIESAILKRDEF